MVAMITDMAGSLCCVRNGFRDPMMPGAHSCHRRRGAGGRGGEKRMASSCRGRKCISGSLTMLSASHSQSTPVLMLSCSGRERRKPVDECLFQPNSEFRSHTYGSSFARRANHPPSPSSSSSSSSILPPEPLTLSISMLPSLSAIPEADWDACAVDAAGGVKFLNPFLSHAFLLSLEESRSAVKEEGWLGQHIVAKDGEGNILGVAPLYLKTHSYGEYVFDHAWANAFMRFGHAYYPKLQSCVPFTPVTGPRILVRDGPLKQAVFSGICSAMKQLADEYKVSSLHITFPTEGEWEAMKNSHGFIARMGMQYHWTNRNYHTFDEFLMDMKQGKRKNIRQERKKVLSQGLKLKRLRGQDIKARHWDSFYDFYRNTTDSKWGQAYLTREFFHMIGERMGDKVLLIVAEEEDVGREGRIVGGALNMVGGDALYGRNWGCLRGTNYPFLHFEACYYQAIEAAIEWGLARVEAGAQGEHKIQRGYLPTATYSAHYFVDEDFRGAVADFVRRETMQIKMALSVLDEEANPFKPRIAEKSQLSP